MYSVVLMAAMVTTAAEPGWGRHGCCGCSGYAGYGCYAGYAGYGCYGCGGCSGCFAPGYGFAGGCYGYHGGCYGGWGIYAGDPYYLGGCTGCYGCYGGYSCYGLPLPIPPAPPVIINPNPAPVDKGKPEVVPPPIEKKKDDQKKASDGQVRAKLHIEIPTGGKLFVDGRHINAAAGTNVFQTPALAVGEIYFYDIRIEVERQGAVQSEQRRVIIRSGDDVAVNFPNLRPSGTQTVRGNN